MDKKRKNILMVAAVAASSAAAVGIGAYFTTKYLVRLALDRQQPKIPHRAQTRLRGYDNCAMMLEKTAPLGKKLQETTHHLVNLRSYDEELLVGHWFPCANPNGSSWQCTVGAPPGTVILAQLRTFGKSRTAVCCMPSNGDRGKAADNIWALE